MFCITFLFPIEYFLGLGVLELSPVLALASGMVFLVKAGMLTGSFYLQAIALFGTSLLMARFPQWQHGIFGIVGALCFFLPGWKYHQQRKARKLD